MSIFTCRNQCCDIEINTYTGSKPFRKKIFNNQNRIPRLKAGICIYDPKSTKLLLVQSRGHLWGLPKGTLQCEEEFLTCAIREVKEETGLIIEPSQISEYITIKGKARYYYLEMDECKVKVQQDDKDNDANAIGWIKIDCLKDLIRTKQITLNKHCIFVLDKLLQITLNI